MKLHHIKIIGWVIGAVLLLGLWVLFGPTKLGGSATYSITAGSSMEPLLHKNDFALVRAQSSYRVNDVVLYQSPVLHKPVLHRIVLIQNGNYFFKGDNNGFVDPGYATQSELLGKLWLHLPAIGGVLGWFSKPFHAALLAGIVVAAVVLTSFTTVRRRKHRFGKPPSRQRQLSHEPPNSKPIPTSIPVSADSETITAPKQTSGHRIPSYFEGPLWTLVILGVLLSLTILSLVVGFSRAAHRIAPLPNAYKQTGTFTYTGLVKAPTVVYPLGDAKTGDPIFPSLVDSVALHFTYQFTSALPHNVKGSIEFKALLLSKSDTWQQLTVLKPITAFTGDSAVITSDVSLSDLYGLINNVSEQSGDAGIDYSADVEPVIRISGTVDGKPISDTFAPVLPFTIGRSVITLNDTTTPTPAGATYVPPSVDTNRKLTLNPSRSGTIPHLSANTVSIAKYNLKVPLIRWCSLIFVILAILVAFLHDVLRRRETAQNSDEQIVDQFESLLVPVASITTPAGVTVIQIPDLTHLTELAEYLERPILHSVHSRGQIYIVDDGACRYVTHSVQPSATPIPVAVTKSSLQESKQVPATPTLYHRFRDSLLAHIIIGIILLAIIATLATSLTASNTVPPSKAGASINTRQISQLTPAGCNSLTLTSIIEKSGTFSNTTSHALIIGSPDVDTITDTGNNNCIVGGGGADQITGTATDICITGPTAGATYITCAKH